MNFQDSTTPVQLLVKILQVLDKAVKAQAHNADWNYWSAIGKLNYLEKSTRPDLAFATHNAARFSTDPREPDTEAVGKNCRYLVGTRDKGPIFDLSDNPELEVSLSSDYLQLKY